MVISRLSCAVTDPQTSVGPQRHGWAVQALQGEACLRRHLRSYLPQSATSVNFILENLSLMLYRVECFSPSAHLAVIAAHGIQHIFSEDNKPSKVCRQNSAQQSQKHQDQGSAYCQVACINLLLPGSAICWYPVQRAEKGTMTLCSSC